MPQIPRSWSPSPGTRPLRIPSLNLPKPTLATVRQVSGIAVETVRWKVAGLGRAKSDVKVNGAQLCNAAILGGRLVVWVDIGVRLMKSSWGLSVLASLYVIMGFGY